MRSFLSLGGDGWVLDFITFLNIVSFFRTLCKHSVYNHLLLAPFYSKRCLLGVPGWLSLLSIGLLIWAQVMISWFSSLSPTSGSMLTAHSLLGILSLPLSAHLQLVLSQD